MVRHPPGTFSPARRASSARPCVADEVDGHRPPGHQLDLEHGLVRQQVEPADEHAPRLQRRALPAGSATGRRRPRTPTAPQRTRPAAPRSGPPRAAWRRRCRRAAHAAPASVERVSSGALGWAATAATVSPARSGSRTSSCIDVHPSSARARSDGGGRRSPAQHHRRPGWCGHALGDRRHRSRGVGVEPVAPAVVEHHRVDHPGALRPAVERVEQRDDRALERHRQRQPAPRRVQRPPGSPRAPRSRPAAPHRSSRAPGGRTPHGAAPATASGRSANRARHSAPLSTPRGTGSTSAASPRPCCAGPASWRTSSTCSRSPARRTATSPWRATARP